MIMIGIDPGSTTGVAYWDVKDQNFINIYSGSFVLCYNSIKQFVLFIEDDVFFRIEDARLRKWFGSNSNAKQQGAGSIKRDSTIWQEVCLYHGWAYEMIHPVAGATKWDSRSFHKITRWGERTNQNARDAALLVYGWTKQTARI